MSTRTNSRRNNDVIPSKTRPQVPTLAQTNLANSLDQIVESFRSSFNDLMSPFLSAPWALDQPFGSPLLQPWGMTPALPETLTTRYPVIDVVDRGDYYELTAELPGFNKDNIDVQVGDDVIQLTAQVQSENKGQSAKYVSHERTYSAFNRVIQFPEPILGANVEGTMKDGILSMRIPKKEPTSSKLKKVALK
ncbi:MAG: Hsp20/alpha crystallin family protein [Nitrososphaerota archaeon]|jgi:HSP20 family protein|nr:Hsp20/alpha crystallin family protein [Nitrososphaerota archaeon]MDG6916989.1 Hsp20/alpha crystallin family protein [Nitrososphaerota archaeon]MDG6949336.1 Hsp20/alpha crystallin family protein [Nitrososphaerota archaeon]